MAKKLILDKKLKNSEGFVRVYRGDAWNIPFKVVDAFGGIQEQVGLDAYGITGYLPAEDGTALAVGVNVVHPACGDAELEVPATGSVLTQTCQGQGVNPYIIVDFPDGPETIQTDNQPLEIVDRSFTV